VFGHIVRASHGVFSLVIGLIVAALWESCAVFSPSKYVPTLGTILKTLSRDFLIPLDSVVQGPGSHALWYHILVTLGMWAIGFSIAAFLGVILGFGLGISRTTYLVCLPYVNLLRALPSAVLWPLLIYVVPGDFVPTISLIVFGAMWQMLFMTMRAVQEIPREAFDVTAFMQLSTLQRNVLLAQWCLPGVFAGLEMGASIALLLTVTAEIFNPNMGGLGWYVAVGWNADAGPLAVVRIYGGLLITALLGYAVNGAFSTLQKRVVPGRESQRSSRRLANAVPTIARREIAEVLKTDRVTERLCEEFGGVQLSVLYQNTPYFYPEQTRRLKPYTSEDGTHSLVKPLVEALSVSRFTDSILHKIGRLRDTEQRKDLVQRDVVLRAPDGQPLLFARSWILEGSFPQRIQDLLSEEHLTIGQIVRELESDISYENLGYRDQISDKINDVFQQPGPILLIERMRLIKLRNRPAILIQEYVRP